MAAPMTLRVFLLGAPAVTIDNQPLQIQRRSLRWMLSYLACQKSMVGRSDLILLFWPDEPEEDARRHLRETLSKLRNQLPDPELILTEQDQVGLDPQRTVSDVQEFEMLCEQTDRACAQTALSTPLSQAVYQKVVHAVNLWRGPRFLAGVQLPESESLNNWLLSASQQLEAKRQSLLERLVAHEIASGDVENAIRWLRAALEGDETNESLHFQLLTLLNKQGRYSEALNYCNYLQELFRREGYSELPPGLLSLARKIREGAARPETDRANPAWPTLADMQVPFIGRQSLLQELHLAVRRGGPVIVFGEAGSGKSRLVRELFFSYKPALRLLLAPARILENDLPFQPLVDMLRHDVQAEEWKQMDLAWVTPLALLLPELPILRPEIRPLQVAPDQEYSLIFEAMRQLLLFLGKKQRFLFFLDNAQWSDGATLAALAYLAERGAFGETGALVLSARPEETRLHLSNFLNRPRGSFTVQRFSLPPFNTEDISALSHFVLGEALNPAVLPRLERETGGNPLFLLETLRLVQDYAFDGRIDTLLEHLPLAGSILALIRERLQQLSPYDAQVLNIAAVIAEGSGGEFSVDLLESTSMLPPEQVVQSLESLAQMNLIRATLRDQPSGGYTFVHDKFREVILLDLSAARKRLLHLRTARALDERHQGQSDEMEAILAGHYEEAGELNAAFQHWLKAALYAQNLYGKEKAVSDLQHAEILLQRLDHQASDVSIYQLYRQWGRLAFEFGDPQMMELVYNRLLEIGQSRQNPLLVGSAYSGLAQMAELCLKPQQGLRYLDKAMPHLEQVGKVFEHIEAANRRGMFMLQLGRYREAQKLFQRAISLGERAGDSQSIEARGIAEYWLSMLLMISGWPVLSVEMTEKSYRDAENTYNHTGMVRAMSMQAIARCQSGRYADALESALRGLTMAETIQSPILIGDLHGSAALSSLCLGDLDSCWLHVRQAVEIAEQNRFSFLYEGMQGLLGQLYLFLGEYEKAQDALNKGGQAGFQNFQALNCHIYLALAQSACGDPRGGLEISEQVLNYTRQEDMTTYHLAALLVKTSLLMEIDPDSASTRETIRPLVEYVLAEAERRRLPEVRIRALQIQARNAMAEHQVRQASELARQAMEESRLLGHPMLEIESCVLWREICQSKDIEAATMVAAQADQRLGTCLENLRDKARTPAIHQMLTKREVAWTKSPEKE